MTTNTERPAYIRNFTELLEHLHQHEEDLHHDQARLGKRLGLMKIGVNYEILPPGRRSALPHAHEKEEEFVFVVSGSPDVWIDGVLHRLSPGDGVAFPAGTGIAHNFLNNTDQPVHLLVVGERRGDCVFYPVDAKMRNSPRFWHDAPRRPLGPHDGRPNARG